MNAIKNAANSRIPQNPRKKIEKAPQKKGPGKDTASFLKQRMNKKVKDLRSDAADANAAADDANADADEMVDATELTVTGPAAASSIAALQADASQRADEFEEEEVDDDANAFYGNTSKEAENTRRRFYGELRKVLAASDIILEVLDARDPASCRCEAIEKEVLLAGKKLVLVLNKIDLVPKHSVEAWMKHMQRSFPAIAFKSAHGGSSRVVHAQVNAMVAPEGLLRSSATVVGADELMQLLKNYSRMHGSKSKGQVAVGIVGYPNVGKSSVINSMKRQHGIVETGGKAGVTKVMQEIQLDSKVTLIDCPGVVFEGDADDPSVVLRNVVRVEHVPNPEDVVEALLRKSPPEAVVKFYNLQHDFHDVHDFLMHIAQVRGKLRRGGGLDIAEAARSVIMDWTTGKFRYFTMPPVASGEEAMAKIEAETAQVVTQLAPQFDIDALLNGDDADERANVLGAPDEGDEDDMADDDEDGGAVQVDLAGMAAKLR